MMKFGRYGQFKKAALSLTSAMLLFAIMLPAWAMAADGQTSIALTQQEQSYIQSIGVVRVGQLRNRYPLSNFVQETGELTGVNEDVLTLLSQKTGLRFEQTPLELNEKPVEVIGSGKYDLIMGVMDNDKFRQNPNIQLSDPFIESTLAIVAREEESFQEGRAYTIAMKTAFSALSDYMKETYPQYQVIFFDTDEQCMEAVKSKKADILMQNIHVVSYLLQKPQYASLKIQPTSFMVEYNCMMLPANASPLLLSILNKGVAAITEREMNDILLANTTAKPYKLTTKDVLYKYELPLIALSISIALCIALLVGLLHTRQRHMLILAKNNDQLAEAVHQAEQANAAKSQFLSRMSHEIRTPMNAIVGITAIAKKHLDEPQAMDEYLDKIDASSKVLLNIINDVLDMSAIEGGKLRIAHEEFDIKTILGGISTLYYTQCKQKNITFSMAVNVTDEMLVGDALRINQILLNLVSNAVKFTSAGGRVSISVMETEHRDNQVFVRFTVEDTGCGMSPDLLSRLFKPFEQEEATTAQKHGGSGLGLSIVKNLTEMMHGAIKVESTLGKGSTFTVDIPFALTGRKSNASPQNLKNIRALVVDDEQHAREYTAIVLDRIGLQYEIAGSGAEAIAKVVAEHDKGCGYDICFVDWKMPDMSGVELIQKIRALYDEDTIIVIISAYDLSEVQDEAIAAGANQFIAKPLFQSTVFNLLMQLSGGNFVKDTASSEEFDFTGHRVLLAEDNALNAEIAVELLGMVNMRVDPVANGQLAVEKFVQSAPGTYDAILMDIQMPVLNGYKATEIIRKSQHSEAKSIPIFAMTANAFTEDVSAALSAGMDGHIAKPIDTGVLYRTLQKVIDGKD